MGQDVFYESGKYPTSVNVHPSTGTRGDEPVRNESSYGAGKKSYTLL